MPNGHIDFRDIKFNINYTDEPFSNLPSVYIFASLKDNIY